MAVPHGTNGTKQAVLYARVSTKDQEREGFSIPAQLKLLRDYARDQGLTIVKEYVDVETAKQTGRKGFGEMRQDLRVNPTWRDVLTEKTDRLYRNPRDWIDLDDLKVTIHLVKENIRHSPDARSSDKLVHGFKVLMAKNYVDNLSEEVKKGQREKAAQGHWPSAAPVGYVNNLATHLIEVDPDRGALIADLFRLYATGDYSLKTLTAKAYAIGLTHPRSGRRMMKAEIHRILTNPIYAGDFRWAGKLHRGVHEPLVSRETFADVQAVLTRRPRARHPKQRHAFMGLLRCGRCGCAMTAEMKKGRYVYYRCTGYKGDCGNVYIRQEVLGDLLGEVVAQVQIPEPLADCLARALRQGQADLDTERTQTLARLQQRERAVQGKLDRAYEDYLEGHIQEAFWMRKSTEWEAELTTVKAELARLSSAAPAYAATGERILELAKQAHFLYLKQDPTEQRRLLETLLSNCTFDRGSLCPTYTKPFDVLVRGRETEDWRGRRDSNSRPLA
jgi:DNA invertase Pin-like site-specific DNA recombinase